MSLAALTAPARGHFGALEMNDAGNDQFVFYFGNLLTKMTRMFYLSRLFAELPKAVSANHFESLLPWNITLAA